MEVFCAKVMCCDSIGSEGQCQCVDSWCLSARMAWQDGVAKLSE